jgi:hypothetical protein
LDLARTKVNLFVPSWPYTKPTNQFEMALSNQVKESVHNATEALRDAMAFAARAEHPITIHTLADILMRLESLECMDSIMEKFGKQTEGKENPFTFG